MSKITVAIDNELEDYVRLLAKHETDNANQSSFGVLADYVERNAKGLTFEKMQESELREFRRQLQKGRG